MTRFWLSYVLPTALLIALGGCGPSAEHADDHLEHHVPAHKPASLPEAIDDIERRFAQLTDVHSSPHGERLTQCSELVDIVRWLPELAGDSDLPEQEWNIVDRISESLGPQLQRQLGLVMRGNNPDLESLSGEFAASLEQLRTVASKLQMSSLTVDLGGGGSEHD
jgi:hypothetical protein